MGDGALDYALVLASFQFINRIADLLHVDPEALPEGLRRFEPMRRLSVWAASRLMRRMDLRNRRYTSTFEEERSRVATLFERATGRQLADRLEPLRSRPKIVEAIRHALEERDVRSTLGLQTIATVHRVVEESLPEGPSDIEGFHPRAADPVEAFAFVGTRYAQRTTEGLIGNLRGRGFDDLAILDLAIAVADANQWARMHRLLGLAPDLFSLAESPPGLARSPERDSPLD